MKLPTKSLERSLLAEGYKYVIGVDEVGMGCLAGPVVVCAAYFKAEFFNNENRRFRRLRESKQLSARQRDKFVEELLHEKHLIYRIEGNSPGIIDKLNIYQAARQAMRRAVRKIVLSIMYKVSGKINRNTKYLIRNTDFIVLVDGKTKIKNLRMEQKAIVGGDRKIFTIACASILAKVYRDKIMDEYAKKYPFYGFEKHKGYGTKYHRDKIKEIGICRIHRRSFRNGL